MSEEEKDLLLKTFHRLTRNIEDLIRTRKEIEHRLLLEDEFCIRPEDRVLASENRLD